MCCIIEAMVVPVADAKGKMPNVMLCYAMLCDAMRCDANADAVRGQFVVYIV
jgi:hypothetical protein